MIDYSSEQLAQLMGCTSQTIRNWVKSGWLSPYRIDGSGYPRFSQEQYDSIKASLPMPSPLKRREWLASFSCETAYDEPTPRPIVPTGDPSKGGLYNVPNRSEAAQKISNLLEKSNMLLFESMERPKTDVHNMDALVQSTKEYFEFCRYQGIMPSFRRLANWYGYSNRILYKYIEKQSPEGIYLDQIKDAIKDNLEQAALINAVNNISAMFILKAQYDYVETTKHVIEPSESLLGQPKTVEEIVDYIDADIVED
jgi:hypothetical protein